MHSTVRNSSLVLFTDKKSSGGIDIDNISDEFEGQGHRSKVKVARMKNVISKVPNGLVFVHYVMIRHHLTSRNDITTSCDVPP